MIKRHKALILAAITLSIILSSCSRESKIWNQAKSNNDISSYKYYSSFYPTGVYLDSAKLFINNIRELQKGKPDLISRVLTHPIPLWDSMVCKEIGLQINISAPRSSKEYKINSEARGLDIAKNYFAKKGITVIPINGNCKTKLIVNLNMKAFGAYYTNFGYLYTGYEIKGKISLKTDGQTPITESIYRKEPVSKSVRRETQHGFTWYSTLSGRQIGASPSSAFPNLASLVLDDKFLLKLWGAPKSSSPNHKKQLSKYDINYIYHSFCNIDAMDRRRAIEIIESDISEFRSNEIISLVTYNIQNYGLQNENSYLSNLGIKVLEKMGADAIDAAPVLIEYMAYRADKLWKYSSIERTLEIITGENKSTIPSWRKWWFNHKNSKLK